MKAEILRLLKESSSYISGQQLCDHFQVSRTAVWKVMEQLKKEGYTIEAVRNKGYRLLDSPDVLSKAEIESLVTTKWAGRQVVYYDETDSTNNQAKAAGEKGEVHGTLFVWEQCFRDYFIKTGDTAGESTDADTCNGACGSRWNQGCAWCGRGNQVAE